MSYGDVLISFRVIEVVAGPRQVYLPRFVQPGSNVLVINRNVVDSQIHPNPGGHFLGMPPNQPVTLGAGMQCGFTATEQPPPGDLFASYAGWGVSMGPAVPIPPEG
jgi:hypothetical protein